MQSWDQDQDKLMCIGNRSIFCVHVDVVNSERKSEQVFVTAYIQLYIHKTLQGRWNGGTTDAYK